MKGVAEGEFCESTLGYTDAKTAKVWQMLFDTPAFKVNPLPDIRGIQVCGAVKNVIALAVGFCHGLGATTNAKAALIRIAMNEMKLFANLFFDGILEVRSVDQILSSGI